MKQKIVYTKLRLLLEQQNMSGREFCDMVEEKFNITLDPSQLSRLLQGKTITYSIKLAICMADVLGVTLDEVIEIDIIKNGLIK